MTKENPFKVGMKVFDLKHLRNFYSSPFCEWEDYMPFVFGDTPLPDQETADRFFNQYKKYLDHEQQPKP